MAVAIVTPELRDGDAVGNDALGMGKALRGAGYDVHYFCKVTTVRDDVRPLDEIFRVVKNPDDVVIYHHSIKCDTGVRAMHELPCRTKVVRYHNVTPAKYYAKYAPDTAAGCADGMRQVEEMARAGYPVWAASDFNARDFLAVNPSLTVRTLPPIHQVERLLTVDPDAYAVGGLDDWNSLVLCVGRMVPNKNLALAVDAFADYRERYDPDARLVLVGQPFPHYFEEVCDRIAARGQRGHVLITGKVTVGQLKALYSLADALLVTSEHEGFCVPLVEAMCLRVPTVAVPNAAIPDTAGDFARYADPTAGSVADALHDVISDRVGREERLNRGAARFRERFTNDAISRECVRLFEELVG